MTATRAHDSGNGFGGESPGNIGSMAIQVEASRSCERRDAPTSGDASAPAAIVAAWVQSAERQLWQAREELKAARRRVVQMEDVVASWEGFAAALTQTRDPASSNPR